MTEPEPLAPSSAPTPGPPTAIPPPRSSWARFVATAALALGALGAGLWLLPIDSDGAFAINDGIHYAYGAENPRVLFIARHPLFHGIAWVITQGLRDAGVEHPGHHAIRIVAALGAAWLAIQITLLAGRRRWVAGWLCALFALCCRYVLLDTAAGETLVIATASSLLTFALVLRPRPSWIAAGAALVLALLFRQDNLLAIPGLAIVMWPKLPAPRRWLRLGGFFAIVGAVTFAGYILFWRLNQRDEAFTYWLLEATHAGYWGIGLTADRMLAHLNAMGNATVGDLRPWIGPGILGACAAAGFLVRGSQASGRFVAAILLTVLIRFFFHSWWAPAAQFHVYAAGAVAAGCAFAARGESPAMPLRARVGLCVLAALCLATFCWHWPSTRMLRERRVMESVEYAGAVAPPGTRFYSPGTVATTALGLMGIKSHQLPFGWDGLRSELGPDLPGYPAMVVFDRFTVGNYHVALLRPGRYDVHLDTLEPSPRRRLLRIDGLVVACLILPP